MKGYNLWSYAPYKPLLREVGDIYICRIAPDRDFIHFEWLDTEDAEYSVFYRKRDVGSFILCGKTVKNEFDILNLETETDYEFYVEAGENKSRIRLARTGEPVGIVVNYLHPDDEAYSFSGYALCSPSMARLPDGSLVCSMDVFKGRAPQNLTIIFKSEDNGKSWKYLTELFPSFWGKLFVHKNELYMLSVSTEYGDLLIGKSTDGGKTFGTPTVLYRGSCLMGYSGIHKNPQNIVYYNGRIYGTLEWGCWAAGVGHAAMVMSADENADLLDPLSWHFTTPVKYNPEWQGVAEGPSGGILEGTLTVFPDGKLYNVLRYQMENCTPSYGKAIVMAVNPDDIDAPLEFKKVIAFPGNHSKFMIQKDEVTGKYFSIVSFIKDHEHRTARNILSLITSDDAEHWNLVTHLIDRDQADPLKVGFQYVAFEFDGDDIIYLCRTAINGAANFHDANYSTFHRIKDFRKL